METLTKKFLSEIIFTWKQRWISVSMLCWTNFVIALVHTKLFRKKKANSTTIPSTGRSLFYLVKLSWWSSSTKETFFALFCFSRNAHTLHFSSWQRMIFDKRNQYSVFISCFSFCFPKYCFVSCEWYFTEKKKRLIISRFGCCFFFAFFTIITRKKVTMEVKEKLLIFASVFVHKELFCQNKLLFKCLSLYCSCG